MRISIQTGYDNSDLHLNHWGDCQRFYCPAHRLLYRECLTAQNDCPRCAHDWDMKHEKALWEKDQKERPYHAA